MTTNSPVTIVTIKNKIPLFKGEEQANAIELIELEEVGYELVANKTLYQIGDKAVLIQPDYNLSDISLFDSFIRPNGDESKSMLGKVGGQARRIRAKKFNLSKVPNGDPVYSNGVLLPLKEVENYLNPNRYLFNINNVDLTEKLGIIKYEEPESNSGHGLKSGQQYGIFPEGLYKTDEENINNLWNHLDNKIGYPVILVGTEKIDGSSITIGITPKIPEGFICSRNLRKKLTINKVIGVRNPSKWETFKSWFGFIPNLKLYEEVDNDDDFVRYGKKYLDILKESGFSNIVLRGEMNGVSLKGSGNKLNPSSKEENNIKFFGIDSINECGFSQKLGRDDFENMADVLELNICKKVFHKEFNSKEELINECENYFKNNIIEGIVVRSEDSKFSAKIMSNFYDSKK